MCVCAFCYSRFVFNFFTLFLSSADAGLFIFVLRLFKRYFSPLFQFPGLYKYMYDVCAVYMFICMV